jgi:hypothetical protein
MTPSRPYQPLLLRVLHGLTGLCLIAAIVTAYWTYEVYDGRWGRIPLPNYQAIEGLHGTFGLWTLLIFPAFLVYACRQGRRRLLQPQSWPHLTQVGRPIWWYTVNRLVNTLALLALTFALYSGKMMDETWLPRGELTHAWYYAHLISWVVMVGAIALHLLINAKVGGTPLLLSMLTWHYREKDCPQRWPAHVTQTWVAFRQGAWRHWLSTKTAIGVMEIAILGSLVVAWLLPLFK